MTRTSVIETARLLLRPPTLNDAPTLQAMWARPLVRRWLWDDRIVTLEETRTLLVTNASMLAEEEVGLWVVSVGPDAGVIGFAGYWYFHEPPRLELAYGLDDRWWGNGFATEAAAALAGYGFERCGFTAIEASTDAPNGDSVRVLERVGFSPAPPRPGDEPGHLYFRLARQAFDPARVPYLLR
jgi:ribosomal-protein-alanine N-acetyltransferase